MRVLVVEDKDDAATSITALLRECGHEAGAVESGDLALRKAPDFRPDVMFIDVASPALDGLTIARRLRDTPHFVSTPLVAVTDEDHFFQAAAEGFDDFLCEPYLLVHIRATMARIGAKVASSLDRLRRSREMADRSRRINEESRRGLEEYRRQRQFGRARGTIRVCLLGCQPAFAEFISSQMPAGWMTADSFDSLKSLHESDVLRNAAPNDCLVVDGTTAQVDGLAVLGEFANRQLALPVIALVERGDVRMAVRMVQAGAAEVVEKPCAGPELLEAISRVLGSASGVPYLDAALPRLSQDECRLLQLTASGALTKQIAREMGISLRTVQLRRAALKKRLGAHSGADLIRLAVRGGFGQ